MPDLLSALTGIQGTTIHVRHELPDASMRLMDTLGVTVEITLDAPECVRFNSWNGEPGRCRRCARVGRERVLT